MKSKTQAGLSLIEVMLSLSVAIIGIYALSQWTGLQGKISKNLILTQSVQNLITQIQYLIRYFFCLNDQVLKAVV